MTWKDIIPDTLAKASNLVIRGFLVVNALILALTATYINLRLSWLLIRHLNRVWFS